jgi:hypothetical protein
VESLHLYRLAGYELDLGGQRCARLGRVDLAELGTGGYTLSPTDLWGKGGNEAPERGEAGLQRALASSRNTDLLSTVCQLSDMHLDAVMREVGAGGGADIAVLATDSANQRHLRLVDCKPAHHTDVREQWVGATRIALAAIPCFAFKPAPASIRIVLLGGCSPLHAREMPPTEDQCIIPAWWQDGCRVCIPRMDFWGYLPFARCNDSKDEELVLVGPRVDMVNPGLAQDVAREIAGKKKFQPPEYRENYKKLGGCSDACLELALTRHFARASVVVGKAGNLDMLETWRPACTPLRRLRELAYGEAPEPWWFVGESNDKGFVRLNWESRTKPEFAPDYAEAERQMRNEADVVFNVFRQWLAGTAKISSESDGA